MSSGSQRSASVQNAVASGSAPSERACRAARRQRGAARSSRPARWRCRATSAARASPPSAAASTASATARWVPSGSRRSARAASASRACRYASPPRARRARPVSSTRRSASSVAGKRGDLGGSEPAPRRRDRFRQRPRRLGERAERCPHDGSQARRRRAAPGGHGPGALDGEQRVAVRRHDHLRDHGVRQRRDAADDLRHLGPPQRARLDLGDVEPPPGEVGEQRVGVRAGRAVAPGEHEQHRQRREPPADVGAQGEARPVGPVHVLGDEQHRTPRRRPLDQPQHRVEQPQPLQLRRRDDGRHSAAAQRAREVGSEAAELGGPPGPLRRWWDDPHQRTGQLLPDGQRGLASDIHACADRDPRARVVGAPCQLSDQPGLADARLAGHEHDPTSPVPRRGPGRGERGQLGCAAEHRCRDPRRSAARSRRTAQPGQ